jgi:hypothetical protein
VLEVAGEDGLRDVSNSGGRLVLGHRCRSRFFSERSTSRSRSPGRSAIGLHDRDAACCAAGAARPEPRLGVRSALKDRDVADFGQAAPPHVVGLEAGAVAVRKGESVADGWSRRDGENACSDWKPRRWPGRSEHRPAFASCEPVRRLTTGLPGRDAVEGWGSEDLDLVQSSMRRTRFCRHEPGPPWWRQHEPPWPRSLQRDVGRLRPLEDCRHVSKSSTSVSAASSEEKSASWLGRVHRRPFAPFICTTSAEVNVSPLVRFGRRTDPSRGVRGRLRRPRCRPPCGDRVVRR